MIASYRLWGAALFEQFGGATVDGDLGLEFGDPSPCGDQFGVVGAGRARQLAGVDQLLVAPGVDRLFADVEICGDLGDAATGCDEVEHLASKLRRVPLGHGEWSSGLLGG